MPVTRACCCCGPGCWHRHKRTTGRSLHAGGRLLLPARCLPGRRLQPSGAPAHGALAGEFRRYVSRAAPPPPPRLPCSPPLSCPATTRPPLVVALQCASPVTLRFPQLPRHPGQAVPTSPCSLVRGGALWPLGVPPMTWRRCTRGRSPPPKPVSRPSFCRVPSCMRSIHPHKCHDGLETGIMGLRPRD